MNWKLFLDYIKFGAGICLIIFSYFADFKYSEMLILIAGLIILSAGVTVKFGKNGIN